MSQSLDRLIKEGVLSVALVFEARIILDIQDIMGDEINRGYKDLLQTTNRIDKIMNLKVVGGAWDVGATGERWVSDYSTSFPSVSCELPRLVRTNLRGDADFKVCSARERCRHCPADQVELNELDLEKSNECISEVEKNDVI